MHASLALTDGLDGAPSRFIVGLLGVQSAD